MIDKLVSSSDGTSGDVPGNDPVLELGQEGESGTSTLLPDIIQLLSTPIKATPDELVSAVKAECNAVMASITRSLQSAVKECQAACESSVAGCTGCLQAKVDTVVRQHSPLLAKCQAKIGYAAKARWDIALDFLNSIGVPMPDQAAVNAVAAGVKAADILASLGHVPSTIQAQINTLGKADGDSVLSEQSAILSHGSLKQPSGTDIPVTFPPLPLDGGIRPGTGGPGECPAGQVIVYGGPFDAPHCGMPNTGCQQGYHPITNPVTGKPDCESDTPTGGPIPPDCPAGQHAVPSPDGKSYICVDDEPPPPPPPPQGPDCDTSFQPICQDGILCYPAGTSKLVQTLPFCAPKESFYLVCRVSNCESPGWQIWQGKAPPALGLHDRVVGVYSRQEDAAADASSPSCVSVCSDSAVCPIGFHNDPVTGKCVQDVTECPAQYHIDPTTGQCVPDNFTCPSGYIFDPIRQACILVPKPPSTSVGFAVCTPADAVNYYKIHASGGTTGPIFQSPSKMFDFGCSEGSLTNPVGYVCTLIEKVLNNGVGYISAYANLAPCVSSEFITASLSNASLNVLNGWFGIIPPAMRTMADYELNAVCQYKIPEAEALTQIRVHGYITEDEWRAGMALNGQCLPWQERILEGSYTYPSVEAAIRLNRRELIDDNATWNFAVKSGIKDKQTLHWFYQLTDFVPGPQDVVRFMIRDVEDEQVVTDGQLDAEFEDKWTGQLQDWSKWQGIDENTMRRYWRAHWQWPAPTQLYEMFHRIREDTPLPDSDEVAKAVTIDEVISVLGINDISPAWRARLAAVSYRVPMRREIGKMYEVGSLDREELPDRLQDLGYSPDDAKVLGEYIARDSAERRAKQQGLPTRAGTLALYKADGLTYQEATDSLIDSGVDIDAIPGVLDAADRERNARVRAANVKTLRTRFMIGDYSDNQVIAKLRSYGIAVDRISAIVGQWKEALELKRKEPSVANLCEWAGRGYITPDEYMRRLENLGYTPEDATHFISTCSAKLAESVAKKVLAAEKEAERIAKRDAKCRPQSKPLCLPRPVLSHSVQTKQVNGKQPVTTTTDTESISSG